MEGLLSTGPTLSSLFTNKVNKEEKTVIVFIFFSFDFLSEINLNL